MPCVPEDIWAKAKQTVHILSVSSRIMAGVGGGGEGDVRGIGHKGHWSYWGVNVVQGPCH